MTAALPAPRGTELERAYLPAEPGGPAEEVRRLLRRHALLREVRRRGPLLCVLGLQAVLTLIPRNTALQDEALYLYAGHRLIDLIRHGTPTYEVYSVYFSGAPGLYPVAAAAADSVGGLTAARGLSLVFALATTALLYGTTRHLFDRRSAVVAAAIFAVTEPILFIGNLATYDAASLMFCALATWLVVRRPGAMPPVLPAAAALTIAFFLKYAVALYFPPVAVICLLVAAPLIGPLRAVLRAALLTALTAAPIGAILYGYSPLWTGLRVTTTEREPGSDPAADVLIGAAQLVGLPVVIAAIGGLLYATGRVHLGRPLPAAPIRTLLALTLIATACAAPFQQAMMHTAVSLHKHVGFGLWFAAPLAGLALSGLLRAPTFRGLAAVLAICVAVAGTGIAQAGARFRDWPNSTEMVEALRMQARPITGRYLVEESEVPRYYLRDLVEPYQWTGMYTFFYTDAQGNDLSGLPAYRAALSERYFDVVVLRYGPSAQLARQLDDLLVPDGGYELAAELDATNRYGPGTWFVWVRR